MHRLWFQGALPWLVARGFLGEVTLAGREHIPADGPVLFAGLHRAGLVDGWAYSHALPRRTVFLIAHARRTPLLRLLVTGIPVARRGDGGDPARNRDLNHAAMAAARAELAAGGTVFVFPEGTSSLGPRHLPFQPGAALLALSCPEATIVPLAIHYVDPSRTGTAVEVVAGPPLRLAPGTTPQGAQAALAAALQEVGIQFPDAAAQACAEATARAAWRVGASYAEALRAASLGCWPHPSGSPGCAGQPGPSTAFAGTPRMGGLPGPVRLATAILNAPVALAAGLAARRLADGGNVVLLWKILASLPAQALWSAALVLTLTGCGWPALAAAYAALMAVRLALPPASPVGSRRHA